MKKRTFFTTLLLFLLFFNGSVIWMVRAVWNDRLDAQKEHSLSEHYFMTYSLSRDLQAVESRGELSEEALVELVSPYARMLQNGKSNLAFFRNGEGVYSTAPMEEMTPPTLKEGERLVAVKDEKNLNLYIYGTLPQPYQSDVFVYRYQLQEMRSSWENLKNTLFVAGSISSGMLALCLLLVVNRLFRPLGQISEASRKIAQGNYGDRLPDSGKDELAEMARSFNHMAEEVQLQVEQLQQAAEQKQQFMDNFAHELRTPLTAVYGYAKLLQGGAVNSRDQEKAVDHILRESERIKSLSEQLLELAVLHGSEIEREQIPVAELFRTVADTIAFKAGVKGISVVTMIQEGCDSVYGNRGLLESLLLNFLDNAVKASADGSVVELTAAREEKGLALSVRDYGHGMSQEQLSRVREPFYRVDKARSRRDGGAGLGLAICGQIAEVQGAELSLWSAPGQGVTAKAVFTT